MKKYSSTLINPQDQINFVHFSKFQQKNSLLKRAKRPCSLSESPYKKLEISLPFINIHIPSYEIINEARLKKQQKILSTPKYQDRRLIDFTMKNVKSKNPKFEAISSKVDFFNTKNQKRLDIKKQKAYQDLGLIIKPKDSIFKSNKKSTSPQIYKLLEKYMQKKQNFDIQEDKFIAIGREFDLEEYQI